MGLHGLDLICQTQPPQMKPIAAMLLLFLSGNLFGQEINNWISNSYVNLGATFTLHYHQKQRFPGVRAFIGYAVSSRYHDFIVNYGVNLAVYHKSIGANLNPLENDLQVDLTHAVTAGYVNGSINHTKWIYTLHNVPFYNLAVQREYGAFLSSHFIFNNHRRNQVVGAVTLTGKDVTLNYYNDGAPPFSIVGNADNFDRWWTGGGTIFYHSVYNYNYAELGFDQFTGYQPLLYELSGILGVRIPSYNWTKNYEQGDENKRAASFNTSEYRLRVFLGNGYAVEAGVMGSLRSQNRVFGVQDMIHKGRHIPYHPNNDVNRFFLGGSFNNYNHVRL